MTTVSVVVASSHDRALLESCLASLVPQCRRASADLIVARAAPENELDDLRRAFPGVQFIKGDQSDGAPALRALGLMAATGDLIAATEDHCVADPGWLDALLASADGADVIGGGMGNAQRRRAIDWAAYFAEYGFYADTRRAGAGNARPLLTAANIAYRRDVAADVAASARRGEWEIVAHDSLSRRGRQLRFAAAAVMLQNLNYHFSEFCGGRFEHGRDFARYRSAGLSAARRWLLVAGTPVLPILLTARLWSSAAAGRRLAFARALPFTVAFLAAWSAGEAAGYLGGPPKASVAPSAGPRPSNV